MSKRNIAIATAAVIFTVAGVIYSQQSGSDSSVAEAETTAAPAVTNSAAPEAIPASVSTDNNVEKINATDNDEQKAAPPAQTAPVSTESE